MEQQDAKKLGRLFGYGYELQEIEDTGLWAGIYQHNSWHANTVAYDVREVAGSNWALELDPVVDDAPPTNGRGGRYVMSPSTGCVEYSTTNYKADLAVDLPDGMTFDGLAKSSWDRILNIRTATGVDVKLKVSQDGSHAGAINAVTRALEKENVPRRFWVVQAAAVKGSSDIVDGDLVI
jgi:hypothetical protein